MLKSSHKSQMEIIGLVIIVLLVSLGIMLVLQFSLTRQPELKKTYMQSQLSSNMLNAMLRSTTECSSITDLLVACANNQQLSCTPNPCNFANSKINYFLDNTLRKWNTNFILSADIPSQQRTLVSEKSGNCLGSKQSSTFPLNAGAGTIIYIRLDICG